MIPNKLHKDFLPRDIVLKLYRDMPVTDPQAKIDVVISYAKTVENTYSKEVFSIKINNLIGFIYFEAKDYKKAIAHFEIVIQTLKPEDYPFLYFHIMALLISSNRLLSNLEKSYYWTQLAFQNVDAMDSAFTKLSILGEYVNLLNVSQQPFSDNYIVYIEDVIRELGFPEKLSDPIQTITSLRKTNSIWNKKLSLLYISKTDNLIDDFKNFIASCEIEWYKTYAKDKLKTLTS